MYRPVGKRVGVRLNALRQRGNGRYENKGHKGQGNEYHESSDGHGNSRLGSPAGENFAGYREREIVL
jgi:hypothetical protein